MAFEDLPKPANYMLQTPDPSEAVRKNVELAIGVAHAQQQRQQFQMAQQLHAAQLQEAQQKIAGTDLVRQQDADFQQRLQILRQKPGGPTTEDIQDLGNLPTGLRHAEALQQNFARLDEKEKFGLNDLFNRAYSAMDKGKNDIAQNILGTAAEAYKNSGQMQYANMAKGYAEGISKDPALVKTQMGMTLDKLDPKFTENFGKQKGQANILEGEKADTGIKKNTLNFAERTSQAALDKSAAETIEKQVDTAHKRLINPIEVESKKLELLTKQRDFPALPEEAQKSIKSNMKDVAEAKPLGMKSFALANFLDKNADGGVLSGKSGLSAKAAIAAKNTFGTENLYDLEKTHYNQVINSKMFQDLTSAGRMSETVMTQLRTGYPAATADPKLRAFVLRTLGAGVVEGTKLKSLDSEWQSRFRGANPADKDSIIGGVKVPAGTSYPTFMADRTDEAAARVNAASGLNPKPTAAEPDSTITKRLGITAGQLVELRKRAKAGNAAAAGLLSGTHILGGATGGG